jgi:hypothetical protein
MVGSVGYVATRTIGQLIDRNINTVGPGLGTTTANLPLAKAHGRTIGMNMWDGIGYGAYDSLQATLHKNFTHGLFMKHSLHLRQGAQHGRRHRLGRRLGLELGAHARPQLRPGRLRPHPLFTSAWNYELPFGKGKKFNTDNKHRRPDLFGGWKPQRHLLCLHRHAVLRSAAAVQSLQCIGCTQTAHQIAPCEEARRQGPAAALLRPVVFRDPLFYLAANPVYTPAPPAMGLPLRGPGFWQLNPAIFKNFSHHRTGEDGVPRRVQQPRPQHPLEQPLGRLRSHAAEPRRLAAANR